MYFSKPECSLEQIHMDGESGTHKFMWMQVVRVMRFDDAIIYIHLGNESALDEFEESSPRQQLVRLKMRSTPGV
jgi:hypothetical protein